MATHTRPAGEYARDEDGDGFCEVHSNTMEGFWSLLRSWLRPHRGISQAKLPLYLSFFEFVHNVRKRGKDLLSSLLAVLVKKTPKPYRAEVYTAIVNCPTLRRDIRIVYLLRKNGYAMLFSTDTPLDSLMLYRYYQARFQIEFLFRDAKQFIGLTHCQARSESALHSHFNACFTALNLMKWHDRPLSPQRNTISIASWKAKFFNALFIERLSSNLAIDLNSIKSSPAYVGLCDFGVLAW